MNKDIITGYCGDKKRLFFVLIFAGLLPFIAQTCPAQSNYLYGSDTRTSLVEFMAGERKQLGGDFAFGGNFIRGNADINYLNSNFGIFKFWERRSVYIKGFVLYNTSGAQKTINQGMESIRYDQCFGKPLKVFIFNTNAYNDFIRLNYRTTSGLGLWYAFAHNAANHGFSIAVTHEYENFKAGLIERAARLSVRNLSAFEISNTAEISADFFHAWALAIVPSKMAQSGTIRHKAR